MSNKELKNYIASLKHTCSRLKQALNHVKLNGTIYDIKTIHDKLQDLENTIDRLENENNTKD